jgi:hypothetical protein
VLKIKAEGYDGIVGQVVGTSTARQRRAWMD